MLDITVKQHCKRLARRRTNGEDVTVIIDSTGLSFDRASQWYEEKYGKKAARTPWRKMHLAIDLDMNIHAIEITGTDVSDSEGMDRILPTDLPIDRVVADGAYYSTERAEALSDRGIVAVTPPPSHTVVHSDANTKLQDQTVQYILEKGSIYAFHSTYGYGLRALVDAQISRIKRCLGATLADARTRITGA